MRLSLSLNSPGLRIEEVIIEMHHLLDHMGRRHFSPPADAHTRKEGDTACIASSYMRYYAIVTALARVPHNM